MKILIHLKLLSLIAVFLLIAGCTQNPPNSKLFKLPSGKEIKVTGLNKMSFQDGDALVLNYQTDIPTEDKDNLTKEVNEIWSVFQKDAEAANLKRAVIRATHFEGGGLVRNGSGYGFAFVKSADGQWHLQESNK